MRKSVSILSAVFIFMHGAALAQQGRTELLDGNARLQDIAYGLQQVCIPAQRAGLTLNQYEAAHRSDLKLSRMKVVNNTKVNMWSVGGASDVALIEDDQGCTVSMSFWDDQSSKIVPDIRGLLTGSADQYQVVSGDPDNDSKPLAVAFCARNEPGKVDSWYLYESLGEFEDIPGQRRRERQKFISIVVPTKAFCPQA